MNVLFLTKFNLCISLFGFVLMSGYVFLEVLWREDVFWWFMFFVQVVCQGGDCYDVVWIYVYFKWFFGSERVWIG